MICPHCKCEVEVDVEAIAKILRDHRGGHKGFPPASWDYELAKSIAKDKSCFKIVKING